MADDIIQFQAGREAQMCGGRRDARRSADWLEGFDMEAQAMSAGTVETQSGSGRQPASAVRKDAPNTPN